MSEEARLNGKKDLKITFDCVRDKNIEQLRVLNNVLFPINYQATKHTPFQTHTVQQESYYRDCLASEEMSQLGTPKMCETCHARCVSLAFFIQNIQMFRSECPNTCI